MKSKRPKPAPPKKDTALRPYSLADFIEEMKSPMPYIDIVSRVHLLTGFNKSAVIILRRYIGKILGYRIWKKTDIHYNDTSPKLIEAKIGKKTYMVHSFEPPKHHQTFLIDFLESLIIGRDVDNYFTGIDPDDYDKHVFSEAKLTLNQIALICRYNGREVTKKSAAKVAQEYGHKGSTKLYDNFRDYKDSINRIRWAKETQKKRDQFNAIRPHLNDAGKAMWNDELILITNGKQ